MAGGGSSQTLRGLMLPNALRPWVQDCGTSLNLFSLSYDVGRELVKNPFPTTAGNQDERRHAKGHHDTGHHWTNLRFGSLWDMWGQSFGATEISYLSLPSGTYCFDHYDPASGQWNPELPSAMKSEARARVSFKPFGSGRWYVEMTIEQEVSYGLDFAFEFALTNPLRTPPSADNAADPGVLLLLDTESTCKCYQKLGGV